MSNTRTLNLIHAAKKYGESIFLCHSCAKDFEVAAASEGGRIIRSTEPTLKCCCCGADNSRLEYRA
jgi:hypothetical protein